MVNNSQEKFKSGMSSTELDQIKLEKHQYTKGLILFSLFSAIAIFVFFVQLTIGDESQIVFGFIFGFFITLLGDVGFWVLTVILTVNLILHIWTRYIRRDKAHKALANYYEGDTRAHTFLYTLGTLYVVLFTLHQTVPAFIGPEIIVGSSTGGSVIPPIVLGVLWIILVGAVFMPFLINYGLLEFIGALLEPLMRPIFKLPGKAALNAVASFLTSSSLAVLITGRLYRQGIYTKREAATVATCFSSVSIGFAFLVFDTAGVGHYFLQIFASSFVIAFILAAIVIRIPPLSRKTLIYHDGREQTEEDRRSELRYSSKTFTRSINRAVKRAYTANNALFEIKHSIMDGAKVIPQVLSMISAVGVSALIIAEYTRIFHWVGIVFQPLIMILQIPDAAAIAPSMPIGLAEMFLPVLLIAGDIDIISEQARFFVSLVSMVQIIFFSETASVMLATKLPISLKELVICFFQRTLLAMPLAALATHLFVR